MWGALRSSGELWGDAGSSGEMRGDLRSCARLGVVGEAALLDDRRVEVQLLLRALDDLLFDGLLRHEAVDHHRPRLADAVGAVHRL